MAKLVFGMSQSLDGYAFDGVAGDLELPPPGPALFHHFYEWVRDLTGSVLRPPRLRGDALLGRRPS